MMKSIVGFKHNGGGSNDALSLQENFYSSKNHYLKSLGLKSKAKRFISPAGS
jgi:hypothetical protein